MQPLGDLGGFVLSRGRLSCLIISLIAAEIGD